MPFGLRQANHARASPRASRTGGMTPGPPTRSRYAWERRRTLLSPDQRPALAASFLSLVEERARAPFTVTAAARALGVSRSALERICRASFQLPPGVMINLHRVASVARDLEETDGALKEISVGHSFPAPSIMNRFFVRFTGAAPAAYRARLRREASARNRRRGRPPGH